MLSWGREDVYSPHKISQTPKEYELILLITEHSECGLLGLSFRLCRPQELCMDSNKAQEEYLGNRRTIIESGSQAASEAEASKIHVSFQVILDITEKLSQL